MNSDLMFSKASDEWSTPQATFDALNEEFGFIVDGAARRENAKCGAYFGPDNEVPNWRDSLTIPWGYVTEGGPIWLNPPYSRVREFIAKAALEAFAGGCTVVCLVPSRTDTRWWHDYVWSADHLPYPGVEIRFIRGRLKFGNSNNSAPFPSVVIIFRPVDLGVGAPCGGRVNRVQR